MNHLIIFCHQNDKICVGFFEAFENHPSSDEMMKPCARNLAVGIRGWLHGGVGCGWLGLFVFAAASLLAATPFENPGAVAPANKIDQLVFARLKQLNLEPA